MKFVYVKWRDAAWSPGEYTEAEIEKLTPDVLCETVGILVSEDDNFIRVALEYFPTDKTWRRIEHIPKKMIEERKYLAGVSVVQAAQTEAWRRDHE
jgi:hypothetical protein